MSSLAELVGDFVIVENHLSIAGPLTPIFGPDPTRWAIIFSASGTGSSWLATTDVNNPVAGGMFISTGMQPWVMTFRDVGSLVASAWFGSPVNPGVVANTIQILYRPSVPTMDLDDLAKELASLRRQVTRIPDHYRRQLSELQAQLSSRPHIAGRK